MPAAKPGNTVKLHYTGRLEDGTVFGSSMGREPLEFTLGEGQVLPGLEQAVAGMEPGQRKSATVPADQAFGPHRKEMVTIMERANLPENLSVEVGQRLEVRSEDGSRFKVRVVDQSPSTVTMDANHELAGKDLTFDLELVEVV